MIEAFQLACTLLRERLEGLLFLGGCGWVCWVTEIVGRLQMVQEGKPGDISMWVEFSLQITRLLYQFGDEWNRLQVPGLSFITGISRSSVAVSRLCSQRLISGESPFPCNHLVSLIFVSNIINRYHVNSKHLVAVPDSVLVDYTPSYLSNPSERWMRFTILESRTIRKTCCRFVLYPFWHRHQSLLFRCGRTNIQFYQSSNHQSYHIQWNNLDWGSKLSIYNQFWWLWYQLLYLYRNGWQV